MPESADSSLTQLYYMPEVTLGVIPATALKELRCTGESLAQNTESTESQELRSDRQVPDVIRTAVSAGGDANIELSYAAHDDLLAGAMMDDWTSPLSITDTCSVTGASGNGATIEDDDAGAAFASVVVGMWVYCASFAQAGNNGWKRVQTKPDNDTITVTGDTTMVNEAAASVTIDNDGFVQLGTTKKSFVLEKVFSDIGEYASYNGMRVSQLELNVAVGSILNGRFGFMGLGETPAQATVGTGATVDAATNSVLNAIDNIAGIREGGVLSTIDIRSVGITLNNNPRPKQALGSVSAVGIGIGRAMVSGTMTAYFADSDLADKYVAWTASDFAFRLPDANGNTYVLDMPRMRFTQGRRVAGGIDQDVMMEMAFTAMRDPTLGNTLSISKLTI